VVVDFKKFDENPLSTNILNEPQTEVYNSNPASHRNPLPQLSLKNDIKHISSSEKTLEDLKTLGYSRE
jgi:hypothetical protein